MAVRPNRKPMKFASGAKDRQQRNAIEAAIADAMSDESGRAMSDSDMDLVNEMLGKKERLAMSMMNESGMRSELVDPLFVNNKGETGRTISDADRKMFREMAPSKPRMIKPKPRPDVGAIERGNRAARRTAQDLASMEDGGVAGGKVPKKYKGFSQLPEKVQEKISPDLAEKYEFGGEVKGKKRKKSKGNVCRGGGAALRGISFSGTK